MHKADHFSDVHNNITVLVALENDHCIIQE